MFRGVPRGPVTVKGIASAFHLRGLWLEESEE